MADIYVTPRITVEGTRCLIIWTDGELTYWSPREGHATCDRGWMYKKTRRLDHKSLLALQILERWKSLPGCDADIRFVQRLPMRAKGF